MVERALRTQAVQGGRLGTNLIEQLALGLDEMAEALGRQHDMPAALQRHFDRADPAVQARLPPEIAAAWRAVPLGRLPSEGPTERIAVAVMDPISDDALYELGDVLGAEVIAAVAPQLRVLYHLERVYGVERPNRFKRASARPESDAGGERRGYVKTLSDPDIIETPSSLARIAVRRIQVATSSVEVEPEPDLARMEGALRAIRRSTSRTRVGAVLVSALEQGFGGALSAGMILTIRSGLLLGWRGFARGREPQVVEAVAVPRDAASVFAGPCAEGLSYFGPPAGGGSAVDRRLWAMLGDAPPAEVGVHPVTVFGKMACVIYVQTPGEMPPATAAGVAELGQALCAALERLVKADQR